MSIENPLTPAGIEPATFRFVAQHLNHCATLPRSPYCIVLLHKFSALVFYTVTFEEHPRGQRRYSLRKLKFSSHVNRYRNVSTNLRKISPPNFMIFLSSIPYIQGEHKFFP